MDHGGDAANIIANAMIDATKGVFQISATLLRELMLLYNDSKKYATGETNIEKLIHSLSTGERIESAVIPKEEAGRLARLSKRHGILYAMAEQEANNDTIIVYYTERESVQMKHLLEDILYKKIQPEKETSEDPKTPERKEPEDKAEDIPAEQPAYQEETEIIVDSSDPEYWIEFRQYEDGSSSCFIHVPDQEPIGPIESDEIELAFEVSKQFEQPLCFHFKGHHPAEEIQKSLNDWKKEYDKEKQIPGQEKIADAADERISLKEYLAAIEKKKALSQMLSVVAPEKLQKVAVQEMGR